MKYANKINSKFSMVLGDNELAENKAVLKNMNTGETKDVSIPNGLVEAIYKANLEIVLEDVQNAAENL